MALQSPQERYLLDLAGDVPHDHPIQRVVTSAFSGSQRVSLSGSQDDSVQTLGNTLTQADRNTQAGRHTICIVENISPEFIGGLGVAWQIPRDFFVRHASNPSEPLWETVMGRQARDRVEEISTADWDDDQQNQISQRVTARYFHVEGIFEHLKRDETRSVNDRFQRCFTHDAHYGWQANTQISCYRASAHLYLFLVDKPFMAASDEQNLLPSRLSFYVPYSWNYRGLSIPQLYERPMFSSFECLQSFFSYRGNVRVMFTNNDTAIDFVTFAYFLSSSLWLTNLRWLNRDVHKIAFRDIRKPTLEITGRLHDRRQDLTLLRTEVQAISTWIRPKLNTRLELLRAEWAPSPKDAFETVLSESSELERFLVDTFQLLMSSINVLDAQTSIEHAERSSHLTILATIYVPLSFVTGVFGMNVREINNSNPALWTFVVVLVVVGVCTGLFLWLTRPSHNPALQNARTMRRVQSRQRQDDH